MLIERSMHADWLTNTFLVADEPGGHGVFIDAGGPVAPLLDAASREQITVTHVLVTHHHWDHVAELPAVCERFPDALVLAHPAEREALTAAVADLGALVSGDLNPGEHVRSGALVIEAIHTPGHTAGMLNLLVNGTDLFTADTLFKGSVGGVRAPGSTSYADIKASIMDVLMALPDETVVHPGHAGDTTIGAEREGNAFVRIWRGVDEEGSEPCTALGEPATLVLLGPDYDGGHKAWVRWSDGRDDIVPGSKVERPAGSG